MSQYPTSRGANQIIEYLISVGSLYTENIDIANQVVYIVQYETISHGCAGCVKFLPNKQNITKNLQGLHTVILRDNCQFFNFNVIVENEQKLLQYNLTITCK